MVKINGLRTINSPITIMLTFKTIIRTTFINRVETLRSIRAVRPVGPSSRITPLMSECILATLLLLTPPLSLRRTVLAPLLLVVILDRRSRPLHLITTLFRLAVDRVTNRVNLRVCLEASEAVLPTILTAFMTARVTGAHTSR